MHVSRRNFPVGEPVREVTYHTSVQVSVLVGLGSKLCWAIVNLITVPLSRGLRLKVRNKSGVVVASPDVFEGITELFLKQDVREIFYWCSGCNASGRINLLSATYGCVAMSRRGESSHCVQGFFRIHNLVRVRCQQHWEPECIVDEFLVAGTHDNNAYCLSCSGCVGQRLTV